jgi:hypothetical protein
MAKNGKQKILLECVVKGTVARDFRPSFFSLINPTYRALIHRRKPFRIWLRIRRDNRFESRQNHIDPTETENEVKNSPTFFG